MALETGTLWDSLKQELQSRGYVLERKLSKTQGRTSKGTGTVVYLAQRQIKSEESPSASSVLSTSPCVLKISTRFAIDELGLNPIDKLDELTQREADIYQALDKVTLYVPRVLDAQRIQIGNTTPIDLLVLEYVDKQSLQSLIESEKPISEAQARKTLADILSALDAAHTQLPQQVLHRDIKPSNILSDQEGGMLIDFNFSYIGEEGAASSTVLQNYGYYPLDTYEQQTASQDLAALGNVIIAAGYAKDISAVRLQQGKTGLDPVDVEGLPFSPKFKRFLRKLTANTPAFRYQAAKQALEDLARLDTMTEEDLEREETTVRRDPQLEELLDKLKKEDELFDYNVSSGVLDSLDDDALLGYLQKIYAQKQFIITDPAQIDRYIQIGDTVKKDETYSHVKRALETGAKGIVLKMIDSRKAAVKFGKETWTVDPVDLIVYGREVRFWRLYQQIPETPADKVEGGLLNDHQVKYAGDRVVEYDMEYIPDGSEGIVANMFKGITDGRNIHIAWKRKKGLTQSVTTATSEYTTRPGTLFSSQDINLIRDNTVPFQRLYEECFKQKK